MNRLIQIFLTVLVLAFFSACKKAVPELKNLKSLSGFSLDQNSTSVASKTAPSFQVSGQCSSKFANVQLSLDSGNSWKKLSEFDSSVSIKCSEKGNFSSSLSIPSSLFVSSLESLTSYNILFRGESEFGYSDSQLLVLNFTGSPKRGAIVAGAAGGFLVSSNSNFKMAGRIKDLSSGQKQTSSGGKYKLSGTLTSF